MVAAGDGLFVYGTLRQGDVRWRFLEPYVEDHGHPDTARGALYDTGVGYPGARFDEAGTIIGHRYTFKPSLTDRALEVMDEVEGAVEGLYYRIRIVTDAGATAWAYQYGDGLALRRILSGDWFEHTNLY